jgi:hypothetical protein
MTRLARIGGLRPPSSRIELTQIPYGNFQLPSLFHSSLRQDWRSSTAFLRIELTQTLRTSTFGCPAVFLLIRLPE